MSTPHSTLSRPAPARFALLLATLAGPLAAALAQSGNPAPMTPLRNPDPRVAPVLDAISKARSPGALSLSPDGSLLAWTLGGRRSGGQIHLTDTAHPDAPDRTVNLPGEAASCSATSPAWSPDGASLAFLARCGAASDDARQAQIYLWSRRSAQARQLTHIA